GTLNIEANFNKGIFSKDDLQIRGGIYNITSADDGIRGKDSVEISAGTFNITSGGDAIRTSNETDEGKGEMLISAGKFDITSELDGLQAVSDLTISGGEFNIKSGGGSSEITTGRDSMFGSFPGARASDSSASEAQSETEVSAKAVKGKTISITGGNFSVDSYDDAFHSDSSLKITSGSFSVKTNDDAFHGETELEIGGGNINILQSYEGLEGESIKITDGTVYIVSADDGLNAASSSSQTENPNTPWGKAYQESSGDAQSSQTPATAQISFAAGERSQNKGGMGGKGGTMGGMGGKGGGGEYNSSNVIEINGGKVFVNAEGDGVDSNGDIKMSGGEVYVFGPESSGNGSLDYAGSCLVTGGTLLAAGSGGMSQSVSSGSVASVNINCSVSGNTIFTVLSENDDELICFVSPKKFSSVVFASDSLSNNQKVSVYTGGTHSGTASNGIYEAGSYTKGTLLGQFTAE
ncbi:MAG: carbohydrate-binding domain-containing protein, partial [Acutalibacteraceae bacterium]